MSQTPPDTTIQKISSRTSPKGPHGEKYLVSGKGVAMRLWERETPGGDEHETSRDYETVGFVLAGRAELHLEGQMIKLEPGDSWLVPKGARHRYHVLEAFSAVEATAPPGPGPRPGRVVVRPGPPKKGGTPLLPAASNQHPAHSPQSARPRFPCQYARRARLLV